MKSLIIFLFFVLSCTEAEVNLCCKNNATLVKMKCGNNSELWVHENCEFDAYMIDTDEFKINNDDSLSLLEEKEVIYQNRYCIGSMDDRQVAMVCFPSPENTEMSQFAIVICCSISIICLILTLAVYLIIPTLRDLQGKCMMLTIFSLLMSFIFLAAAQNPVLLSDDSCMSLAFLMYFWFISTFFWLNIVSFNVWRSVVKPKLITIKKYLFYFYNMYGWGGPLILLIILIICHHTKGDHLDPGMGIEKCWFSETTAIRAYFYAPILALLILNIIMFISTAWTLATQTKNIAEQKHKSHKFKFCLYLKLFIIMGICWIFEPISEMLRVEGSYIWIVTDYINGLQGLIIFLLLVVFRKRVRKELGKKWGVCCRRLPKEWTVMADEECEELEEEVDELTSQDDTNRPTTNPQINL